MIWIICATGISLKIDYINFDIFLKTPVLFDFKTNPFNKECFTAVQGILWREPV